MCHATATATGNRTVGVQHAHKRKKHHVIGKRHRGKPARRLFHLAANTAINRAVKIVLAHKKIAHSGLDVTEHENASTTFLIRKPKKLSYYYST